MRTPDYNQFIEEALDGMSRIQNCRPFFQTVKFKPVDFTGEEHLVVHCFKVNDTLYKHISSNLIRNYSRPSKRHLQPRTYDFIDAEGSKSTTIARLEPVPHIHSIVLVDGSITQKYHNLFSVKLNHDLAAIRTKKAMGWVPSVFQNTLSCIETVHLREIAPGDLKNTLRYASKLLAHPVSSRLSLFSMSPDTTKFRKGSRRHGATLAQTSVSVT